MLEKSESEILSENLIMAFVRFKRMMDSRRSAQHNFGHTCHALKESEAMLLFRLRHYEEDYPDGISVSELSRAMHIKPPSVTSLITGLERANLAERRMDPNDRRIVRIKLTDAGNEFIDNNQKRMFLRIKDLVEHLGPEKSRNLAELINETYDYYYSYFQNNSQSQNGDE